MSVDYSFYPRIALDKNIDDFRRKRFSFEGYVFDNSEFLCKEFGLPEIPCYYAQDKHPYEYLNSKAWFKSHDLPRYYFNNIIESPNENRIEIGLKRYKSYCDWINWGLDKLNSIEREDILKYIDCEYNEVLINTLEDIKKGIPRFLELYKKNYYLISEV